MASNKVPLTLERLKHLLHYNPTTGIFTWRETTGRMKSGKLAGTEADGYIHIKVDGKIYGAQRLAWFYMTGEWPVCLVDHRNTRKNDNIWENLREATELQNAQNKSAYRCNKSGFKGASFFPQTGRWRATIRVNKRHVHLGFFSSAREAGEAYATAAIKHHGEYANTSGPPAS
jgi:hypothetical protein